MSPELQAFYNAYATWLNDDAPETVIGVATVSTFCRGMGLCTNFWRYNRDNNVKVEDRARIEDELFAQLGQCYPFGGLDLYNSERVRDASYLNAQRRAWVHKHSQVPVKGEV